MPSRKSNRNNQAQTPDKHSFKELKDLFDKITNCRAVSTKGIPEITEELIEEIRNKELDIFRGIKLPSGQIMSLIDASLRLGDDAINKILDFPNRPLIQKGSLGQKVKNLRGSGRTHSASHDLDHFIVAQNAFQHRARYGLQENTINRLTGLCTSTCQFILELVKYCNEYSANLLLNALSTKEGINIEDFITNKAYFADIDASSQQVEKNFWLYMYTSAIEEGGMIKFNQSIIQKVIKDSQTVDAFRSQISKFIKTEVDLYNSNILHYITTLDCREEYLKAFIEDYPHMMSCTNDNGHTPLDTAIRNNNYHAVNIMLSSNTLNINDCTTETRDTLQSIVIGITEHGVHDFAYAANLLKSNNITEAVNELKNELNDDTISCHKDLNINKSVLKTACVITAKSDKKVMSKPFYSEWAQKLSNDQYWNDIVTLKSLITDFSKLKDEKVLTNQYSEKLNLLACKADLIEATELRKKYINPHTPKTEVVQDFLYLERMFDEEYCYAKQIEFYKGAYLVLRDKDSIISDISNIIDSVITKFTELSDLAKELGASLNDEDKEQLESQLEYVQKLKDTLNLPAHTHKEIQAQERLGQKQKTRGVSESSSSSSQPATYIQEPSAEEDIRDTIPSEMISEMLYKKFVECAIADYFQEQHPNNNTIHILAIETVLDYEIVIKTILSHEGGLLEMGGTLLKKTFDKLMQTELLGKNAYSIEDDLDTLEKKSKAITCLKDAYQQYADASQDNTVALRFQTAIAAIGTKKNNKSHNTSQKEENSRLEVKIKDVMRFCQNIDADLHLMTHEKHSHQTEKSGVYDRYHFKSTAEQFLSYADTKVVLELTENTSFSKEIYDSILLNFAIQTSRNSGPHQKISIAKLIPQRLQGDTQHESREMDVYHNNIIQLCASISKAVPSGVVKSVQCEDGNVGGVGQNVRR